MEDDVTNRGFSISEFVDRYGAKCSIQKSSLATEDAIWLGCDEADPRILVKGEGWKPFPLPAGVQTNTRMHLSQENVKELLPYLNRFVKYGEICELTFKEKIGYYVYWTVIVRIENFVARIKGEKETKK